MKIYSLLIFILALLPPWVLAEIQYNYPHVSVEADGPGGDVSLVPRGGGKVKAGRSLQFNRFGDGVFIPPSAVAVATPATSFPTPGAAELRTTVTVIATAAPTAMWLNLPQATPYIGSKGGFLVVNRAAYPISLVPQGGTDTANAKPAATPFACPASSICECFAVEANSWFCK